jgi:hypothetical protein
MSLHRLAPIVLRKYGNTKLAVYKKLFSKLAADKSLGERFWLGKNLRGAKKYGTGQSGYSNLALDLKMKLGL